MGGNPKMLSFMQFSQNIDGFTQMIHRAFILELIQLYKQNPLEKFFIFIIYQNNTLALTGSLKWSTLYQKKAPSVIYKNTVNPRIEKGPKWADELIKMVHPSSIQRPILIGLLFITLTFVVQSKLNVLSFYFW